MRKLSFIFSILATIALTNSCKKDSLKNCTEHEVSPCNEDSSKTNIRIKNISEYDYCNVTINPSNASTNYGILAQGETTCYKSFDIAYNYCYVELKIGNEEFVIQPIDYVGEPELGIGYFTYSIDVSDFDNKVLSIQANQD
ncbi:hypothetical protein K6119_10945 [Paracrocinitomix mangrovi]|uniref:hypothetical protein n=1 Tax=Paracrocinitomix mangrovi TaxID=2862509 RepID=UPI001C8ED702|nr:hypothetical protein [Paracrocinitomix mangrovi]UKN00250.1 hypothetical protein K6119_10945 [Paracrocinitomix mangrovi]